MRRAAVSIAEGTSRSSRMAYARFVEIATGSLFEDVSHSFIARRQGFLSDKDFQHLYHLTEDQSRMLSGLRADLVGNRTDH